MQDLILAHLQTPDSKRDEHWEKKFFELFPQSLITLESNTPQEGPDGFPYFLAEVQPQSTEPALKLIEFVSSRGIGLVVNASKGYPDYIFNFGMLWNYRMTGRFLNEARIQPSKEFSLQPGQKILAGSPHSSYLPPEIRTLLRQFLMEQGFFNPKILVVGVENEFDLCFSKNSFGNLAEADTENLLRAISWFLPQDYRLALVSEAGLPTFEDL